MRVAGLQRTCWCHSDHVPHTLSPEVRQVFSSYRDFVSRALEKAIKQWYLIDVGTGVTSVTCSTKRKILFRILWIIFVFAEFGSKIESRQWVTEFGSKILSAQKVQACFQAAGPLALHSSFGIGRLSGKVISVGEGSASGRQIPQRQQIMCSSEADEKHKKEK